MKNKFRFTLQKIFNNGFIPSRYYLQRWINLALANHKTNAALNIRIVDETESADLNQTYRKKSGPTNILSFPFLVPKDIPSDFLGDLVVCAPLVTREATAQQKPIIAHWAHLIIHGTLHLLGYDHINNSDAEIMEALEIKLLAQLNYPDPYN